MARYPAMVRRRIVELYDRDYSTGEIAEVFGVCESGVRRVRQHFRERGTLAAASIVGATATPTCSALTSAKCSCRSCAPATSW